MDSWWREKPSDQEQAEVLGFVRGANWVDRWVRLQLEGHLSASSQALFRQWRALHSYQEEEGRAIIGLPVLSKNLSIANLVLLQNELGLVFSYLLRDTPHYLELSPFPLSEETLYEATANELLLALQDETFWYPSEVQTLSGCDLWLGRVQSSDLPGALHYLTSHEGPRLRYLRAALLRIEALLEAAGAQVKLLPPQSLWNAGSYARIGYARGVLGALNQARQKVSCVEKMKPTHSWTLQDDAGRVSAQLWFREETSEDLLPLRRWVARFNED